MMNFIEFDNPSSLAYINVADIRDICLNKAPDGERGYWLKISDKNGAVIVSANYADYKKALLDCHNLQTKIEGAYSCGF